MIGEVECGLRRSSTAGRGRLWSVAVIYSHTRTVQLSVLLPRYWMFMLIAYRLCIVANKTPELKSPLNKTLLGQNLP